MQRIAQKTTLILMGLLVFIALLAGIPAAAQEANTRATLAQFYNENFPQLSAYLDVHDAGGNFVHGLRAADVQILEDTNPVPLDRLEELHPGVQFVIAVAPGPLFDIRDADGISRYDYLRQSIYAWDYPRGLEDDLSLITPWGSEIAHVDQPTRILAGLSNYVALGDQAFPDLQILSRALELASNPTPRPGMERAILFITVPQAAEGVVGLQSLAARANELGIRIYVWVVAGPEFFDQPDSAPLRAVSGQTGGQFFAFSGSETVPDLEEILEPLRYIYQLSYTSRLTTSGSHQVSAQIAVGGESISSNMQTIDVTLLPPQAVFVSPPSYIQRAVPSQQTEAETSNTVIELLPVEQALEVMISFPDGYTRPLVRTTLYVDGAIAGENIAAPFELFTWDLRGYTQSGKHVLQVEAVDSLGLSGVSVETQVQIDVPPPERNILAAMLRNKLLIAGLGVLIAGAVLALVLILGGKIRPPHPAQVRRSNGSSNKAPVTRPQSKDPVTQPVQIAPIPESGTTRKAQSSLRGRLHLPQQKNSLRALAYLSPLAEAGEATLSAPLPLDDQEAVLGSDPLQATILLDDASVDPVHAILRWEDGSFRLVDNGGVAGTWVNYAQIGPQGVKLEHGDLIYAGRVGFRFNLKNPGRLHKPFVRPYEGPGM
ncbi:MAG: hypothetical protein A2Z49_05005 [Chloroflexi bacterium RBG_19FT_COMBO_56_12]|nr:MAG: hypothetical protein A2Z49_05005 [Chloroflexi bacterium RBG_19FT_COMBO_56_12]